MSKVGAFLIAALSATSLGVGLAVTTASPVQAARLDKQFSGNGWSGTFSYDSDTYNLNTPGNDSRYLAVQFRDLLDFTITKDDGTYSTSKTTLGSFTDPNWWVWGPPGSGWFSPSMMDWNFIRGASAATRYTGAYIGTSNWSVSDAAPTATSIPTPALLPGLIGMGIAAVRKRKSDPVEGTETVKG